MGKARTHRPPCRIDRGNVRPFLLETLMTELEIVLSIAVIVLLWAYRGAVRRADHFKCLLLAVGVGAVRIEVNEEQKTYKVEVRK
jgi:hypothetical protein